VSVAVVFPLTRVRPALEVVIRAPEVDVVIPVYNEERDLAQNVRRLHAYLRDEFPFAARITIADNASTDGTWSVAMRLAAELPNVRLLHLNEKGRGRALAAAWLTSDARVVAYMDVDLSTNLSALLPLVAPVLSGHSDVSIGSRLARGARVARGIKRELISRAYNLLLRLSLGVRFRDAQCGFKALRADVARRLLPRVQNRNWFFDTELLVVAERAGLRIHELEVDWADDPDSRVDIVATAMEDLRGIWRLATGRFADAVPHLPGQLGRFAAVGVLCTLAYAGLFWLLRETFPATVSNSIALVVTAVANTAANRRVTFGVRGSDRLLRDHAGGLVAFAIALVLTNVAILMLNALAPGASLRVEIAVLIAVNVIATGARFLILRTLLFHLRRRPEPVS
jgi:glycosyltransferase involved in cell wall biosynthesis